MDLRAMRSKPSLAIALLVWAAPGFASATNLSILAPGTNSTVSTPFLLNAVAAPCSSQPVTAMGYSIDYGATTAVKAASIYTHVTSPTGAHLLHVKSWGSNGAVCVADVPINVVHLVTNVSISTPANDASVSSLFSLVASGTECQSQSISAMGYSLDTSSNTILIKGESLNTKVASSTGTHTLHVKAWGAGGASCVTNRTIYVSAPVKSGPAIPTTATAVKAIQNLSNWKASFDTATGSSAKSTGAMNLVASPSRSGSARMFLTTYSNYGGERYSAGIGADATAQNFVYDAWFYLAGRITDIANVEMDLNQVIGNGDTVIYGFQCDGWSHTWDYTANTGTPSVPKDTWLHSNQTCNPQSWSANTWHHVQVSYSRNTSGDVTYKSVWFDGAQQNLDVTVNSAFALGWGSTVVTNFQIDGATSTTGSATVYMDELTIYRW
jgi:hypothetical protein